MEDKQEGVRPDIQSESASLGRFGIWLLGVYFIAMALVLMFLLFKLWPPEQDFPKTRTVPETSVGANEPQSSRGYREPNQQLNESQSDDDHQSAANLQSSGTQTDSVGTAENIGNPQSSSQGGNQTPQRDRIGKNSQNSDKEAAKDYKLALFDITWDQKVILLIIIAAALGSYVHSATSFVDFVGNRQLVRSWVWWYILRTPIGVALALIMFFLIKGGLLQTASSEDVNLYGVVAVSGLVGMFSKQATDKLREVFDTLFNAADSRKDKLENPVPSVAQIERDAKVIKVRGNNFAENSIVRVNGKNRETKYLSNQELSAELLDSDLPDLAKIDITVFNPAPGGGTSNASKVT